MIFIYCERLQCPNHRRARCHWLRSVVQGYTSRELYQVCCSSLIHKWMFDKSLLSCTLIAPSDEASSSLRKRESGGKNSPTPANGSPRLLQQWPLLVFPFCPIWIFPSLSRSATVSDSVPFDKTGEGFTLTLCLTEVLNDSTKKKKKKKKVLLLVCY